VKKGVDLRKFLLRSVIVLGAGIMLFSRNSYFPLAVPFALIIGMGSLTPMAAAITIIQTEAASHMRGRAMSFAAMSIFGMLPLGCLMIGTISQKIGAPLTMLGQGILAILIAMVFGWLLNKRQHKQSPETTHYSSIKID
jgi:MFS family permease